MTLGLDLLSQIATRALDLKFEAQSEIEKLDEQEPLRVLAIVKKKLGILRQYVREVTADEKSMERTAQYEQKP